MSNPLLKDTLERTARILGQRAGLQIVCRGNETPRTDGNMIILPSLPSPCPPDLERLHHAIVDHEVGHVLYSDFELLPKFRKRWGEQGFQVLNVLEDIRIETLLVAAYPGSQTNLATAYAIIEKRWKYQINLIPLWSRMMGALFAIGKGMDCSLYGDDALEALDLVRDLLPEIPNLKSTRGAASLAAKMIARWREFLRDAPESELKQDLRAAWKGAPNALTLGLGEELSRNLTELPQTSQNGSYRVYSRERDRVETAPNHSPDRYQAILDEVRPLIAGMRQRLLMTLRGERQNRLAPDPNGTLLHKQRLYQILLPVPQAPFASRIETPAQDTAVSLLIDLSGSMQGARIEMAQKCAVLISEIMGQLSFPLEVIGFSTGEDHSALGRVAKESGMTTAEIESQFARYVALLHVVYKGFNEPLKRCRGRFAGMSPANYTPLNESVVFAGRRLLEVKASRRLMIVLTDGECFLGSKETRHLVRQNLIDNLAVLEKSGIDVIGIGIQTEHVKETFTRALAVHDLTELPVKFTAALTERLLKSA